MEPSKIVHLDSYRGRRQTRLRRVLALHCRRPEQIQILRHLADALPLAAGDRGAVVWLDEYGPDLVRPFTLLDLASDRPRRFFSPAILQMAWEDGVPGILDLTESPSGVGRDGDGIQSSCVVSLGSEGARSWFLVVDSLTPRSTLSAETKGHLMFIAGELASIVLHRDLAPDKAWAGEGSAVTGRGVGSEPKRFPGWEVLGDIEGRQRDRDANRRVMNRFLLARLVRGILDDELVVDAESLAHQVQGIRGELGREDSSDREWGLWVRVLATAENGDHEALLGALLEWGKVVENQGHQAGALEIQTLAYDLAVAIGSTESAVDAARFRGKGHRTQAHWDEAVEWYGIARRVAEETGNIRKLAAVMDGLANTYRDRGNLPRARELLQEVMTLGETERDRYAVAIAHHDLMTVERLCENWVQASHHGWMAVQEYDSEEGSLKALFDLAGVLIDMGELSAARDAYTIVAEQLPRFEHHMMALDALSLIAARQGDRRRYGELRARMELEGWQDLSPIFRGQVLFYRGLSSRALGMEEEGLKELQEALEFAEEHGLNWLIFDIEKALEEGRKTGTPDTFPAPAASGAPDSQDSELSGVRQGLRELREALIPSF